MRTFSWRASILSKRQRSTEVAASEKSAKFTPLLSHVAPNGYGKPSQVFTEVISAPRSYRIWNPLAITKIDRFYSTKQQDVRVTRAGRCMFGQFGTGDALQIHLFTWGNIWRCQCDLFLRSSQLESVASKYDDWSHRRRKISKETVDLPCRRKT